MRILNAESLTSHGNIQGRKAVLEILAKPESLITFVPDRPGHDRRYAIDATKISKELGWEPRYRLLDVLPELVRWYRDNETWWRRIKAGEYKDYYERIYSRKSAVVRVWQG